MSGLPTVKDHENAAPVDLSYLRENTDDDPQAMAEIINLFRQTFSDQMNFLEQSIGDGKNEKWSELSHMLKGAAGYVGAEHLKILCEQGQDLLVATREERVALFGKIQTAYREVCDYLEKTEI
jgi:HPt (histidine-containing phosphotransfer) domain-containing protein